MQNLLHTAQSAGYITYMYEAETRQTVDMFEEDALQWAPIG